MELEITIDFSLKEEFTNVLANDFLLLKFNSFESLEKYLQHPRKILIDEDFLDAFSPNEIKKLKGLERKLNRNLDYICNLIRKQKINVLNCRSKYLKSSILDGHYEVDLNGLALSLEELKEILNFSWPLDTQFFDDFNKIEAVDRFTLLKTYEKIEKIVNPFKQFNPSPAEAVLYAYDVARSRVYKKCISDEKNSLSRDLNLILDNEEIVCAGFVNLFNAICFFLGVPTDLLIWEGSKENISPHASPLVYLNDPKYGLFGLYAFEPTWNSKKSSQDSDYILNCKYAFIPLKSEIAFKERRGLTLTNTSLYGSLKNFLGNYEAMIRFSSPEIVLKQFFQLITNKINGLREKLNLEPLPRLITHSDIESALESLEGKIIPFETFRKLLIQTRYCENAINPDVYKVDEHSIDTLLASSISFKFEEQKKQARKRLLQLLFDEENSLKE